MNRMLLCALAAAPALAAAQETAPAVKAGPYRVVIDRIAHNRTLALTYRPNPGKRESAVDTRRSAQLQLAVYADGPRAAAGLTTFQVTTVTADGPRRPLEVPHYGGMLPNTGEGAVLRAYIHLPTLPPLAKEVRTVEGHIVAWDESGPMEITVPLSGKLPAVAEKDGVRAEVRELGTEDGQAQLLLWLQGPEGSMLLNTETEGAYGVALLDANGKPAAPAGGGYINPRPHQAEYRLEFSSVKAPPASVRVRLVFRKGPRRTYPFRVEHVPLPSREK